MFKLIQGDCLEVMQSLIDDGVKVDMILTDPPYGTTACKWDSIIPLDKMWECITPLIYDKTPIIFFSQQPFTSELVHSKLSWFKHEWIYQKKSGTNWGSYKYAPAKVHENIIVFCKKSPNYYPIKEKKADSTIARQKYVIKGSEKKWEHNSLKTLPHEPNTLGDLRYPISVRTINNLKSDDRGLHPTQKPVELLEYLIKTYTNENDLILDFTMGSGSTGVACINTNRQFIGIELDKDYYQIAQERCKNYQTKLEV